MLGFFSNLHYPKNQINRVINQFVLEKRSPKQTTLDSPTVKIDHFTVVCLVDWPLNESEAGVDLVLIETTCFHMQIPTN